MKKHIITNGPTKLKGSVTASGSKNASLPIIAACLLFQSTVKLNNIARLKDISVLLGLLASLNVKLSFDSDGITLDTSDVKNISLDQKQASLIRGSVLILGPLLARFHRVVLPMPGGCKIGKRPIDFHLKAMEQLGATIVYEEDRVIASAANGLIAGNITFPLPSVTATENALMAASLAPGVSTIENGSVDSEVLELVAFLKEAGVRIDIKGSTFIIQGHCAPLTKEVQFSIMSDRMEVGTWIAAAGITRSHISVKYLRLRQLETVIEHAREVGIKIEQKNHYLSIDATGPLQAKSIKTGFEPEFPTDLQAPFAALNAASDGTWFIEETIWENRFDHIKQFKNLGVEHLLISGQKCQYLNQSASTIRSGTTTGKDLRGTCSLLLLSLKPKGSSTLIDSQHIERGYENFIEKLNSLGASIKQYPNSFQKLEYNKVMGSNKMQVS